MKRKNFTYLLAVLLAMAGSWQMLSAQNYFKSYYINETFSGLGGTLLPDAWTAYTGGNSTSGSQLFGTRGGSPNSDDGYLRFSNTGTGVSGGRGTDLAIPSPEIATSDTDNDGNVTWTWGENTTWFVEFDWKADTLYLGPKNTKMIALSGSASKNQHSEDTQYIDAIFSFYLFGDGYFHYWNMDLMGPAVQTSASKPQYNGYMGPVYRGTGDAPFSRSGYSGLSNTTEYPDQEKYNNNWAWPGDEPSAERIRLNNEAVQKVAEWNASTKMNVAFKQGAWYTITAEMDFKTQKVVNFTIAEKDNPSNSQTISDKPFLAPSIYGEGTESVVPLADRIVRDIARMSVYLSRSTAAGNGHNGQSIEYIDNYKVYYMKPSIGEEDVTIYYKDQDGNEAKTSRTALKQQIGELFRLSDSDKEFFTNGGYYYAYDAEATISANAGKGNDDGETLIPDQGADNTLTVYFKKYQAATGTLTWIGAEGPHWSQTEGNFKSSSASGIGYQNGLPVAFSETSAPTDVQVNETINMGSSDVTVSVAGYDFSGTGKITGTGKMNVNASATLGATNELKGGVRINTTSPVTIKSPGVGDTIYVVNNANLKMEQTASISKPIKGAGKGSTLNIEAIAANRLSYGFSAVKDISTVNITLRDAGKKDGSGWTNSFTAKFDSAQVVNVINGVDGGVLAGFGNGSMANVTLNLGDSIRLVREYNESDGGTYAYGAINGTSKSVIEAGYVNGRTMNLAVGGLNTNAKFEGDIRPYTEKGEYVRTDNTFNLNKVGKATWELTGYLNFPGNINAQGGVMILYGMVDTLVNTIQVDSAAILGVLNKINVKASNTIVNKYGTLASEGATFTGDIQVNGTLQGSINTYTLGVVDGTLKLGVNSFNSGDYNVINSMSDIIIMRSTINLTVRKATAGSIIQLINSGTGMVDYTEGYAGCKVYVNDVDITDNTEDTPGAEFVYYPDSGELLSLVTKEYEVSVEKISADEKTVKFVEYYDFMGRRIANENAKGIVIRKTVYDDNSLSVDKVFVK